MIERFVRFPQALATKSRLTRLGAGGVPALLAHPDWQRPAPVAIWLHGRTATKELDPGRYLRWIRAGIAVCAIDLPSHGERADTAHQTSADAPDVIAAAVGEIDSVVEHLGAPEYLDVFDTARLGIGGM